MARFFGGPSQYLLNQKALYKLGAYLLVLALFIALFWFWIFSLHFRFALIPYFIVLGIYLIVSELIKFFARDEMRHAWAFRHGIDGETYVHDVLSKLPNTCTVIQDVILPEKKSNIDFVVVGPNGIFSVEVKSHKGNITFDGRQLLRDGKQLESDFLYQARNEAITLGEYLRSKLPFPVYAQSLLVFSHPRTTMRFGESPIRDVVVIGYRWLVKYIESHSENAIYTPEQINQIVNLLIGGRNDSKNNRISNVGGIIFATTLL